MRKLLFLALASILLFVLTTSVLAEEKFSDSIQTSKYSEGILAKVVYIGPNSSNEAEVILSFCFKRDDSFGNVSKILKPHKLTEFISEQKTEDLKIGALVIYTESGWMTLEPESKSLKEVGSMADVEYIGPSSSGEFEVLATASLLSGNEAIVISEAGFAPGQNPKNFTTRDELAHAKGGWIKVIYWLE